MFKISAKEAGKLLVEQTEVYEKLFEAIEGYGYDTSRLRDLWDISVTGICAIEWAGLYYNLITLFANLTDDRDDEYAEQLINDMARTAANSVNSLDAIAYGSIKTTPDGLIAELKDLAKETSIFFRGLMKKYNHLEKGADFVKSDELINGHNMLTRLLYKFQEKIGNLLNQFYNSFLGLLEEIVILERNDLKEMLENRFVLIRVVNEV